MVSDLEELYRLIRHFEGCRLTPYLCPARVWTCGWGSTGPDVMPGRPWTQEYADYRMRLDAARFAKGVLALVELDGDRLCAVSDFAYNLGLGNLRASTFLRKLRAGDVEAAKVEVMRWVYAGGRRLRGLELRRAAERDLL